jgi:4-amino-4-deoxy-L-arabinose transferase-like glycosyltransferase
MQRFLFIGLCITGILFRLWFVLLVPQPIIYDQLQYKDYAKGILEHGIHKDTFRLYGYPLLLTPFVYFSDVTTVTLPWKLFFALLDTGVACMIFYLATKLFQNKNAAWISFLLYLFNPFTSAYAGVLLSEICAIFFLTLTFFILYLFLHKKTVPLLLFLTFLLAYLPQIRPTFILFDILIMIYIQWYIVKNSQKKQKIFLHIASLFIFCIPFTYNLISNYIYFDEIAPMGVDNVFIREAYVSMFIDRSVYAKGESNWPAPVLQTWGNFTSWDKVTRHQNEAYYKKLLWEKITSDPQTFINSHVKKMWYVWEKHYVYPYIVESRNPVINTTVYWGNVFILTLGAFGLLRYVLKSNTKGNKRFSVVILFFIMYMTLGHVFSTSEERYSLPAYPLIFLFAGWGIVSIYRTILRSLYFSPRM